jgi:hypothetical protein
MSARNQNSGGYTRGGPKDRNFFRGEQSQSESRGKKERDADASRQGQR